MDKDHHAPEDSLPTLLAAKDLQFEGTVCHGRGHHLMRRHFPLMIHAQDDNFVPVMTAFETAMFAASMLLPPQLSIRAKRARAREVLAVVGLTHCENTMVRMHTAKTL